ncbi:hypothetical protein Dimus_020037 [Dionaea muscipula]
MAPSGRRKSLISPTSLDSRIWKPPEKAVRFLLDSHLQNLTGEDSKSLFPRLSLESLICKSPTSLDSLIWKPPEKAVRFLLDSHLQNLTGEEIEVTRRRNPQTKTTDSRATRSEGKAKKRAAKMSFRVWLAFVWSCYVMS